MQEIVDTHIHFWQPENLRYPWLDALDVLNRPHLPSDLPDVGEGSGGRWKIDKLVFVQAECLPENGYQEAAWVSKLAEHDRRIQGIVAFAPLEIGDGARAHLEALRDLPLVKGVRRLIQSEPAGFCIQSDFVRGVQILADYGFSFDICVFHYQLPDVIRLVEQCPDVQFVLDHIGKPNIKDHVLDPWRDDITRLADYENVMCKISGMVNEAHPENWVPDDLQPYAAHVLEAFGIGRVMFGGDSPVFKLVGCTYVQWVNIALELMSSLANDEKQAFFVTNAERFYRLQAK